jgi:hypothetical protein
MITLYAQDENKDLLVRTLLGIRSVVGRLYGVIRRAEDILLWYPTAVQFAGLGNASVVQSTGINILSLKSWRPSKNLSMPLMKIHPVAPPSTPTKASLRQVRSTVR